MTKDSFHVGSFAKFSFFLVLRGKTASAGNCQSGSHRPSEPGDARSRWTGWYMAAGLLTIKGTIPSTHVLPTCSDVSACRGPGESVGSVEKRPVGGGGGRSCVGSTCVPSRTSSSYHCFDFCSFCFRTISFLELFISVDFGIYQPGFCD